MTRVEKDIQIIMRKEWFDKDYRMYNEKIQRLTRLNKEIEITDTFRNKTYTSLNDLDLEAEVVREEIRELEQCQPQEK